MAGDEHIIEEFVQEATRVLDQTGHDLVQLAEKAYGSYDAVEDQGTGDISSRSEHLAQVARQFEELAERSAALSKYLMDGLVAPPEGAQSWPRIRIIQSQEEERSRLARELEESVGQLLANAVFELASSRYLLGADNPTVDDGLAALQAELEQGLTDVRQLIADLDPLSVLSSFGLMAGLRRYLERYETRTGLKVTIDIRSIIERLPATMEVAVFRIVQESLENIRRHANASRVDVNIYEQDGQLVFSITDDGIGLQPQRIGSRGRSLGLVSMRDRAELLKGKLRIRSDVGQGTQVIFSVPYPIL